MLDGASCYLAVLAFAQKNRAALMANQDLRSFASLRMTDWYVSDGRRLGASVMENCRDDNGK